MIEFHLDTRSGVAPYLQLIQQVRQALRLGLLREGDQLPTVKEVSGALAINPNTVLKAYRELEYEGLAAAKPGVGTFVTRTLSDGSIAAHRQLSRELLLWYRKARAAGLDGESIDGIYQQTMRSALLSVEDHLRFGAHMNPAWDNDLGAQPGPPGRPGS